MRKIELMNSVQEYLGKKYRQLIGPIKARKPLREDEEGGDGLPSMVPDHPLLGNDPRLSSQQSDQAQATQDNVDAQKDYELQYAEKYEKKLAQTSQPKRAPTFRPGG